MEYLNCPRKIAEFHEQHPDKPQPKRKRKAKGATSAPIPIETDTPNAGFGRPAAALGPIQQSNQEDTVVTRSGRASKLTDKIRALRQAATICSACGSRAFWGQKAMEGGHTVMHQESLSH